MSFPVPIEYSLNDNQDATVVVYNDGKEIEGLPYPGCFSQENLNKFADRWISGNIGEKVVITAQPSREYSFSGAPFMVVFYKPSSPITRRYVFSNGNEIIIVVLNANFSSQRIFYANSTLEKIDTITNTIPAESFFYCSRLNSIILRCNQIVALSDTNAFNSTPYRSGSSGGEIYIPKALYDHLGDGSELDYKAAANWSTIDGYGTITWRQIEGSKYEFNYADGTPIGSI